MVSGFGETRFDRFLFFCGGQSAMLLRFAVLVGGTHKARIIANLLLLHFGLAALNHYIEIGEIESDRQRLGVASVTRTVNACVTRTVNGTGHRTLFPG